MLKKLSLAPAWIKLVNWIENGDLVPFVILLSVPHYAGVLQKYEHVTTATAFAILVDIGHYRTIKAVMKGNKYQPWGWMILLTVISYGFHTSFYYFAEAAPWAAFILGGVVPSLLFALAKMSNMEKLGAKAKKDAGNLLNVTEQVTGTPDQEAEKVPLYKDWRFVPEDDRIKISSMSNEAIRVSYHVQPRTAINYGDRARQLHGDNRPK